MGQRFTTDENRRVTLEVPANTAGGDKTDGTAPLAVPYVDSRGLPRFWGLS
jgi:hypothetical protein